MIAQMKKGVLEFCILYIVSKEELYGYEILKKLISVFTDTNESTIYAILRRLLADEYMLCYSKDESNGPPRKYYKVTKKGSEYLSKSLEDWNFVKQSVDQIMS